MRRVRRSQWMLVVLVASVMGLSGCTGGQVAARHSAPRAPGGAPGATVRARVGVRVSRAAWRLPTPLAREVVLARGGELLVAGGLVGSGHSSAAVLRIDPATGSAHPMGSLAVPVHDAAGAVLGGHGVIFGGGGTASVRVAQSLRPHRPALVVGKLSHARSDLVAATVGNTAYLLGGYDGKSMSPSVLETTDGRDFRAVGNLPVPVRYPAVAVRGHFVWLFGGRGADGLTDVIQRLDVRTGDARVVGHLATPLAHASALVLAGQIYLAGGQSPNGTSALLRRFHPVTATLTVMAHLPTPVRDAGAAVIGDTGYLLGGGNTPTTRVIELRPGTPTGRPVPPHHSAGDPP